MIVKGSLRDQTAFCLYDMRCWIEKSFLVSITSIYFLYLEIRMKNIILIDICTSVIDTFNKNYL